MSRWSLADVPWDIFDPTKVDTQLGCAVLLTAMRTLDESIKFTGE